MNNPFQQTGFISIQFFLHLCKLLLTTMYVEFEHAKAKNWPLKQNSSEIFRLWDLEYLDYG